MSPRRKNLLARPTVGLGGQLEKHIGRKQFCLQVPEGVGSEGPLLILLNPVIAAGVAPASSLLAPELVVNIIEPDAEMEGMLRFLGVL